uniref:Claudin n=1 Tax=Electrophorus electricus TaxID=8005 RepID=A0A4W4H5U4_ELEEL
MQAPGILMSGVVLMLVGWILSMISTISPNWRTLRNITGESPDVVLQQGIWAICQPIMKQQQKVLLCSDKDQAYFTDQVIVIAEWMMVCSLSVSLLGLSVVIGAHSWMERLRCLVAALGGLLILGSGALVIIPIALYAHRLTDIPSPSAEIRLGHCIVLGGIGGAMEALGGFAVFTALSHGCCEEKHGRTVQRISCKPYVIWRNSRESNIVYKDKEELSAIISTNGPLLTSLCERCSHFVLDGVDITGSPSTLCTQHRQSLHQYLGNSY